MNSNENEATDLSARRRTILSQIGHFALTRGVEQILCEGGWIFVPHSPTQAALIMELHDLQNDVWDFLLRTRADYLETNPEDYRQHGKRSHQQRVRALMYADRLIIAGLLSNAQGNYYEYVRNGKRTSPKLLPPDAPDWRLFSETKRQRPEIQDCSRLFRLFHDDKVKLSSEQLGMLARFEPIVQQGLDWIKEHKNDHGDRVQARFLSDAEKFATLGILTQPQIAIVHPEIWT